MRLRFRCALMWLLLLALPLQGFAAATLLNCGPTHHCLVVVVVVAAVPDAAAAHLHAQSGHHPPADQHPAKVAASKCSADHPGCAPAD